MFPYCKPRKHPGSVGRRLTPRSRRAPTAARASPAQAKFIIVLRGAYTLRCRARLTSNVRQRSAPLMRSPEFHRTGRAIQVGSMLCRTRKSGSPSKCNATGVAVGAVPRRRAGRSGLALPRPCSAEKAPYRAPGPASRHTGGFAGAPHASPNPSFNASPNGWPVLPFLGHFGYRPIQFRPGQPPGPR